MPSVDNWIGNPLSVVNKIFEDDKEQASTNFVVKVQNYFERSLASHDSFLQVPSLNDVPLHNLQTNSLVRFRCMVQDMYDPEYFLGTYEVQDHKLGTKSMHTGLWKDLAECGAHQTVLIDSSNNKTMERQTLYCVPLPAENKWVKEMYASRSQSTETPSTSSINRQKRSIEDEDDASNSSNKDKADNCVEQNGVNGNYEQMDMGGNQESLSDVKKSKIGQTTKDSSKVAPDLNFPLPGETGPACLVKVYGSDDMFKVNDMVEFIGILSNDPAMVDFPEDKKSQEQSAFIDPDDMVMDVAERQVHHPPPSLVPRLHVLLAKKLSHSNPLLPATINDESVKGNDIQKILEQANQIRQKMITLLEEMLYGDVLAAEYLLCHLISSVYARHDIIALGKFSLNLQGCPRDVPFPSRLSQVLEKLVTKTHLLPLTVPNLNNSKFSPSKDYSANRLTTGQLQLSDNTHVVVDETVMEPGQLDSNGVRNLTAVGNVIQWQKVEYDFCYHKQDFPTNLEVLVMSEGKSLLKCDCNITLAPQKPIENMEQHFNKIHQNLTAEILQELRYYLGLVQLLPYSLAENVQKDMENDFVEMRKENPDSMSVDDFHSLLVLTRLVSLSHGQMTLNKESWEKTKKLELQRKQRMQSTAQSA